MYRNCNHVALNWSCLQKKKQQMYLLQPSSEDILKPYVKEATNQNKPGRRANAATVQLHRRTTQAQRSLEIHLTFISSTPTVVSHVHVVAWERCMNVGLRAAESGAAESVVQEVRGGGWSRVEACMRQDPNRKKKKKKKAGSFYSILFFFLPPLRNCDWCSCNSLCSYNTENVNYHLVDCSLLSNLSLGFFWVFFFGLFVCLLL